jgi:hypothetical protein
MPGTGDTRSDELDQARAETRSAFENRALMYYYTFDELSSEIGRDRAADIMKRAIRRRGEEVGRKYAEAARSGDLDLVGEIFCTGSPCGGSLFHPGVEERGEDGIVLRMTSCPLVDAWRGLGLAPEDVDILCEISAAVDEGTFQGAGLDLTFLDRIGKPGSERCLLELRLPEL